MSYLFQLNNNQVVLKSVLFYRIFMIIVYNLIKFHWVHYKKISTNLGKYKFNFSFNSLKVTYSGYMIFDIFLIFLSKYSFRICKKVKWIIRGHNELTWDNTLFIYSRIIFEIIFVPLFIISFAFSLGMFIISFSLEYVFYMLISDSSPRFSIILITLNTLDFWLSFNLDMYIDKFKALIHLLSFLQEYLYTTNFKYYIFQSIDYMKFKYDLLIKI